MTAGKCGTAFVLLVLFSVMSFFLCSCGSTYEVMQAEPAPVTNFISDPKKLEAKDAKFPFDRFWYDKDLDWGHYKKIKVMPVDTSHILEDSVWDSVNSQYIFSDKEIKALADYMQKKFVKELENAKNSGVTVTDTVDNETLVLHLSLTQLVPTKAVLNATWTTVGIFVPFVSMANMLNAGSIAFEGKLTEGTTSNVVMMFTDRRKDEGAVINLRDYTWYENAYGNVDKWAKSFAEMTESDDIEKVEKPFPFSFLVL